MSQNENHELTYQLKEQKIINADQAEEIKRQNEITQVMKLEVEKLRKQQRDQQFKNAMAGAIGLFTGIVVK